MITLEAQAARDLVRRLTKLLERVYVSRARWKRAALAAEQDASDLQRLVAASTAPPPPAVTIQAGVHVVPEVTMTALRLKVAALESDVEARKEDERALADALRVVRAELGRLLDTGVSRPTAWILGEVRRIRTLTETGDEEEDERRPASAPETAT